MSAGRPECTNVPEVPIILPLYPATQYHHPITNIDLQINKIRDSMPSGTKKKKKNDIPIDTMSTVRFSRAT